MDRPFVAENAKERERLRSLVADLTDEELSRPLGTDWTVAVALAHLAFWDRRSLVLMQNWEEDGVAPCPIDVEVINETLLPEWLALPPKAAAVLAVSAAKAIDRELEKAPDKLITAIERLGERYRLYRSDHRKQHLDQIKEALKKKE
jgi:Mycothiol maleylpyruvate isomerase N-terminal domain